MTLKALAQSDPDQECDRYGQHHQIVEKQIRRYQQRAGCERRGFQRIADPAAPHQRQQHRDRATHDPLKHPCQLLGAAEIPHQRVDALHLAPRRAALGEEGLRKHRHPVKERLPALGAEGEPRCECHRDRHNAGREEHGPLRGRDQHQGKQQSVLRLVAEQPETDARQYRPRRHQIERAADQRRREETILPDQGVGEHHRKCRRQQQAELPSDGRAHHGEIGHEADRSPADEGYRIGKMRQQAGDEQKRRRIVPGEVALIALAEHRDLNLLLDVPIIGQRRVAIEHQLSSGPDVDEIGRDAQALGVEDPPMG